MSSFKKFNEYLDSRGKTEVKGKVNKCGDEVDVPKPKGKDDPHNQKRDDTQQVKEYMSVKGKLVDPVEKDDGDSYVKAGERESSPLDGNPYRAANSSKSSSSREIGFGDSGAKELVYNPKTDIPESPTGGKMVSSWPKNDDDKNMTKSETFIKDTEGMTLKDYTKHILDECGCKMESDSSIPKVTSHGAGQFHPFPPEAIRYVVALGRSNDRIFENFIQEAKESGSFGKLVRAMFEEPEMYDEIKAILGEGVAPPMGIKLAIGHKDDLGLDPDDEDDEEEELDDEEMDDEMDDEDDLEGDLEDEDDMGDPDDEFSPDEEMMGDEEGDDMDAMPQPSAREKLMGMKDRPQMKSPMLSM